MPFAARRLLHAAHDLGFSQAGVIPAGPAPHLDAYFRWIESGHHGAMGYLARPDRQSRRRDLNVILPGVRSLVLVALNYATTVIPPEILRDPRRGRISNYAWGTDYHAIMTPRLEALADWLAEQAGTPVASRVYVDTGAILERGHAQQAGLGFIGKNTMHIQARGGSYHFLGEILTTLTFDEYNTPHRETMCGTCTRCLEACPTGAFDRPYVLDTRRCISYLTIELKETIPVMLRPGLGNWVYGCDLCQEVCPFTRRFTQPSTEKTFWPETTDRAAPPLADLLTLDEDGFRARFAGTAIARIKRDRLVRNACIAAGNSRRPDELSPLVALLAQTDPSPLVREHAAWAWAQLGSR